MEERRDQITFELGFICYALKCVISPPENYVKNDSPSHIRKLQVLFEKWSVEDYYIRIVFISSLINGIIGIIISAAQGAYKSRVSELCDFGREFLFLYLVVVLYIVIIAPYFLYVLRNTNDAYGVKYSLTQSCTVGVSGFAVYVVINLTVDVTRGFWSIVDPINLIFISLIINHYVTIVNPLLEHFKGKQVSYSAKEFLRVLADKELFDELKQHTIEDFSSENIIFWEEYTELMRKAYLILIQGSELDDLDSSESSLLENGVGSAMEKLRENLEAGVSRDFIEYLMKFNNLTTIKQRSNDDITNGHPLKPAKSPKSRNIFSILKYSNLIIKFPLNLMIQFIDFYEKFISENAPLQVNIPETQRARIEVKVNEIRREIESYGMNAVFLNLSSTTKSSNIVLRHQTPLMFRVTMFDEAKAHVMDMIFTNSFSRFIKERSSGGKKSERGNNAEP